MKKHGLKFSCMIKYLLLMIVTIAVSSATLHAGEDCGGCKGKDKEKTEQKS